VLLIGERGTGREHLARVLHGRGPHAALSFVPVDCGRTDSSELKRIIKQLRDDHRELEALRAGTMYLKDIAAAPRDVQDRLAEWLSSGSDAPRVIASSEFDLAPLVAEDRFVRELYYELTTAVMELPPLRDRPEDVPLLAQLFLEETNRGASKQLSGFAPETWDHLQRYRWPGNVGELQRVIRSAAAAATGPQVQPDDLPSSFRLGEDAQRLPPSRANRLPLDEVLAQTERAEIEAALAECRGNVSRTAELLGWSRPKLYRRLEALGLAPDEPT
jgi:DNA-binding NtrC family response regulator